MSPAVGQETKNRLDHRPKKLKSPWSDVLPREKHKKHVSFIEPTVVTLDSALGALALDNWTHLHIPDVDMSEWHEAELSDDPDWEKV